MTTAPTLGNDLIGSVANERNERRARLQAIGKPTPKYEADQIPRGRCAHIGDGLWLRRCQACDDYVIAWGCIWHNSVLASHELDMHGIEQGPLLPK